MISNCVTLSWRKNVIDKIWHAVWWSDRICDRSFFFSSGSNFFFYNSDTDVPSWMDQFSFLTKLQDINCWQLDIRYFQILYDEIRGVCPQNYIFPIGIIRKVLKNLECKQSNSQIKEWFLPAATTIRYNWEQVISKSVIVNLVPYFPFNNIFGINSGKN